MPATDRELGELTARVDNLERDVREIKGDVKAVLAIINQGRGAMWMGGMIGTIGGPVVMKVLQKLGLM